MFFRGYKLASPAAIAVLVAFFMPWFLFSCGAVRVTEPSGFSMATSIEVNDPMGGSRSADGNPLFFIFPLLALAVIGLALLAARRSQTGWLDRLGPIAIGIVGLVALYAVITGVIQVLVEEGIWEMVESGMAEWEFGNGLWLTALGLVFVVLGGVWNWLPGSDKAKSAQAPPPSANQTPKERG